MGEMLHEELLNRSIATRGRLKTKAADNAPSIGVNNEYRLLGGIKDYGVCCLFANPMDGEKFFPEKGKV